MRNFEAGLADRLDAVDQQIEVQRARAVGDAGAAVASELLLNGQQGEKQIVRAEFRFERNDGIEEAGLGGEAYGFGGVEQRLGGYATEGCEAGGGGGESSLRRASNAGEIGAEADVCGWHEFQLIAVGRRCCWDDFCLDCHETLDDSARRPALPQGLKPKLFWQP